MAYRHLRALFFAQRSKLSICLDLTKISALGSPPPRSSATATPASGPIMPATYSRLCALPFAAGFVLRPVASLVRWPRLLTALAGNSSPTCAEAASIAASAFFSISGGSFSRVQTRPMAR